MAQAMDVSESLPPDKVDNNPKRKKGDSDSAIKETAEDNSGNSLSPNMKRQRVAQLSAAPSDSMSSDGSFEGFTDEPQKRDNIVIITPNPEDATNFFSNNVKIYRLLMKSPFGKCGILENNRNLRKKIQSVKIKTLEHIDEILKMDKLGDFNIRCHLIGGNKNNENRNQACCIGVIGPIGVDATPEEVQEILLEEGQLITKVERLNRSKKFNYEPTNLMKIWFTTETLPEIIIVMAERFKVRPFINRSYQCYNCQQLGHIASTCTFPTKCVVCAEEHKLGDCPNRENGKRKCANCGGTHTASFGECSFIIKEKKVQKLRSSEGLSYSEAVKKISQTNERSNPSTESHKNVSTKAKLPTNSAISPEGRQRNNSTNLRTSQVRDASPVIDARFLGFLFEIIKLFQKPEPETDKFKAISDAYRLHYKGELNCDMLKEMNFES